MIELNKLPGHLKGRMDASNIENTIPKSNICGVCTVHYAVVTMRSVSEAMNAARTFSRFMAYKPVKSINGFIANEILEAKDLGDASAAFPI